jgi:serine/threonine protein phosphatase PrpC
MTVLRAAAATHTGYVRSTNQDLALVSGDLVAVADGMGGHLGGEVAARTAIEELLDAFLRERTADGLVSAARLANRAVWRKSRIDRKLQGMGTTLTAAALVAAPAGDGDESGAGKPARLILVNVGDSRAYVLDRSTRRLRQLTDDHSVVEEMVRQGELTPEEASVHPHRHVLTRALGIEPEVALDIWELEAETGSRFLLCSDGLTNEVPDEEIARVLATAEDPEQAGSELVSRALGHGGMDNVTVVVADVIEGDLDPAELAELVPPGPPLPEDPVAGTPDLTEAVPVAAPAETVAGVPAEPVAGAATGRIPSALGLAPASTLDELPGGPAADGLTGAPTAFVAAAEVAGLTAGRRTFRRGAGTSEELRQGAGSLVDDLGGSPTRPVVLVRKKRERAPRDRIVTFRVVVFVLILAALLGGTAGVVIWYNQTSYFIGLHGESVAIYQGRPGGILWFKPQLIETSRVTTSDLLPSTIATLRGGIGEPSLPAAEFLAARLRNEKAFALAAVTTTTTTTTATTSTTTTSLPPATTPSTSSPPTTQPKQAKTPKPTTTTSPPTTRAPTTTTTTMSTTTTTTTAAPKVIGG